MTAHHQWLRLKTALHRNDAPLPDDLRRWLLEAASRYDGTVALDKLLGLRGPGVRTLATVKAKERRDLHLRIAWQEHAHGGDPGCPPQERNRIFIQRVRRFERKWPRIQHREQPPDDLDALDRHLFFACRAKELPSNDRWLVEVAGKPPGYSPAQGPGNLAT